MAKKVAKVNSGRSVHQLLMKILSDSGIGAIVISGDKVIKINESACKLLKGSSVDFIGESSIELLSAIAKLGAKIRTEHSSFNGNSYEVVSFSVNVNTKVIDNERRRIFNEMDDLYCKIALDGTIVNITPSIFSFSGFTREDVIGTSIYDYYADEAQKNNLISALSKFGKVNDFIIDLFRKDGSVFTTRGSMHVVFDEHGVPVFHEGILTDISAEQRLEDEIFEKEAFFREVVESVPDAVFTIDEFGIVTAWNKAAVEVFQWTAEEAIGRPVDELVNTVSEKDKIPSEDVVNGKIIRGLECTRHGKNGKEIKVAISAAPIIVHGKNHGAVAVYTDLSDRESILRLLREKEVKFRAITESAQDAVIIIDSDSKVSFFNTSAELMFGYHKSETLGKKLHHLIAPEEYWEMIEFGFANFKRTGQGMMIGRVVEMEGRRKNGIMFPVELSVSSFFLNGGWHATGILRDISERKRIELELIEAREGALNAARTKSEFLANMSHEIRTPLNAIIGTTDLMLETDLTQVQKSFLKVSRNASDNLLNLINDILDISKVEAGRVELEEIPFNLYEELEKTCETLALRTHEKGLELNCRIDLETPRWVKGDPSRLKQVLINLIGNAIKFTSSGEITVSAELYDSGRIKFSVMDTGIGIPEGKVEAIFMSFTQADSSHTRRYGGTGLGLAICTKLVELMGGNITVESEVGVGSTFSFYSDLPETDSLDLPDSVRDIDLKGKKILVADDNKNSTVILGEILTNWGAFVDTANGGVEALRMARSAEYDVILLDYGMPEINGLKTIEYFKQDDLSVNHIIMMLTCEDSNTHLNECKFSGVERFIFKPVRRQELILQIRGVLGGFLPSSENETSSFVGKTSIETKSLSILLAEDSPDNRFLILKYTESFPWEITIAENGKEALDHYLQNKFDIILMDMQMPIMDGYEATRSIRAHEAISMIDHVPIVALTAHALKEEVVKCLDAGCDIHISKPVRKKKLVEKLDQLMKIMGPREGIPLAPDIDNDLPEKFDFVMVESADDEEIPHTQEEESLDVVHEGPVALVPEDLETLIENRHSDDEGISDVQEKDSLELSQEVPVALVPEDLETLIPGYMKNRYSDVTNIRQLVSDGDFKEAQRLAHSMKGSGGGYGFSRISELGASMEIAAKSLDGPEILSGIDELEIYLKTVRIEYVDEDE